MGYPILRIKVYWGPYLGPPTCGTTMLCQFRLTQGSYGPGSTNFLTHRWPGVGHPRACLACYSGACHTQTLQEIRRDEMIKC